MRCRNAKSKTAWLAAGPFKTILQGEINRLNIARASTQHHCLLTYYQNTQLHNTAPRSLPMPDMLTVAQRRDMLEEYERRHSWLNITSLIG